MESTEPIKIPDDKDLVLIRTMLDNIGNDNIRNDVGELERRYGKAAGTLAQAIFNSQYKNELEILNELKGIRRK